MQPPPPDTFIGVDQQLEPLFVVIDGEKTLQFDHTANCRGYWISTGQNEEQKVYYWLQEPCDVRPPCPDDKSQADMHFDARVVLAVVSLLCDKIFSVHTALDYVGKPIEQVLQEKPLVRLKDPTGKFERRLLAKYQSAVSVFLNGHLVELNRKCTFMKSLAKLTPENTLLKKEQILKWTLTAEKQSGRYSWGGLLPNQENHGEQDFVISGDREVVRNVLRSVPLLGLKGDATSAEQLLIAADEQVQNAFQRNGEDDKESSNSESGSLEDSDAESDSTEPPKKKRKSSDEKGKAAKQRPRPQSDVVGKKGGTSSKSKHSSTTATTGKNQQKRSQPEMSTIDENENLSSKNPAAKKSKKTTKHVAEEVGNENLLMYSIGRMEIVMVRENALLLLIARHVLLRTICTFRGLFVTVNT